MMKNEREIKYNEAYEKLEGLNLNLHTEYSAWGKDKNNNIVFNLNEVAISGKVRIVAYPDKYFGGKDSKGYRSRVLTNPTWLTLYKHSDKAMKKTLDEHHTFFEGFDIIDNENDVKVIELVMGS